MAPRDLQLIAADCPSDLVQTFAPEMYKLNHGLICGLHRRDTTLPLDAKRSIFAARTFNISGNVATYPHKDFMNHAPNWCAITALGRFNPDRGGHIILWEYRLIVRFPPGSTICIPSATVTHSNVQVARGEVRMSFTQYTAAGLFRWAACKFQSMQDFSKNHPEEKQRMDDSVEKRVEDGLRLYMKASDLRAMQLPG